MSLKSRQGSEKADVCITHREVFIILWGRKFFFRIESGLPPFTILDHIL